jgi:hypothetical protein
MVINQSSLYYAQLAPEWRPPVAAARATVQTPENNITHYIAVQKINCSEDAYREKKPAW